MSLLLIQWLGTTGYTDTDRDTSTEYQQADAAAAALYLQLWLESWTAAVPPAPASLRRSVSALTALLSPVGSRRSTYTLDSDLTVIYSDTTV